MVEGISELVAASGISVPARAQFVGRYVGFTTFGSISLGLVFGQFGAMCGLGPILPFVSGAWLGYTITAVHFLRGELDLAHRYIKSFPKLVVHVLDTEFRQAKVPSDVSLEKWFLKGGIAAKSWCILAAQSCRPHVQEIQEEQLSKIVESYGQKSESE
eukprot:TRINITY_DN19352_c0_g1_i1.p1 TRINITY_DN19352_c0_g1~~TRINITY_DN19352_c0_g1_i1.p1  ORF type:complete len:172 (+),score=14.21 TRINITY_DN19352_c0_g1_i1:44-517(+)